jgi:hypothetical protein
LGRKNLRVISTFGFIGLCLVVILLFQAEYSGFVSTTEEKESHPLVSAKVDELRSEHEGLRAASEPISKFSERLKSTQQTGSITEKRSPSIAHSTYFDKPVFSISLIELHKKYAIPKPSLVLMSIRDERKRLIGFYLNHFKQRVSARELVALATDLELPTSVLASFESSILIESVPSVNGEVRDLRFSNTFNKDKRFLGKTKNQRRVLERLIAEKLYDAIIGNHQKN